MSRNADTLQLNFVILIGPKTGKSLPKLVLDDLVDYQVQMIYTKQLYINIALV